jgi:putative membrane protein insertion efficiency factor
VSPVQRLLLIMIRGYQAARFGRPSPCRFQPSCSEYAVEAIASHGAPRGLALAAKRVLRCRPFGARGFDPVPAK